MHSKTTRTKDSRSLFGRLSAMLGVTLFVGGGFMLTDVRSATAAVRNDIIIPTSLVLTLNSSDLPTLEVFNWVSLSGAWSIPNGAPATAGDTFSLTLPPEFDPTSSVAFPLRDPVDPSIVYANCSFPGAAPYVLTCTFTNAVEGKQDVGGVFAVWLVAIQTTTATTVQFEVGSTPVVVQLPGQGTGLCTGICAPSSGPAPTEPVKSGHRRVDGSLFWRIQLRNDTGSWSVSDVLSSTSPAPAHFVLPNSYSVRRILASEWPNYAYGEGFTSITGDVVITPGAATANVSAFQIDYTDTGAAADYVYWIEYQSEVSGPYDVGAVFNNTATVNGVILNSTVTADQGGNGTGSGVTTTTTMPVTTTTTVPVTTTTVPVTTTTVPVTTTTVPVTTTTVPVTTTTVPVTTTTVPVTTTTVLETTTTTVLETTTTTVLETTTTTVLETTTTTVLETTVPTESSSTTTSGLPASGGPTLPPTKPSTFPPAPLPVTGSSTTLPLLMMAIGLTLTGSALLSSRRAN